MRLNFYSALGGILGAELHLTPESAEEAARLQEVLAGLAAFCPDGTAVVQRPIEGDGISLDVLLGRG